MRYLFILVVFIAACQPTTNSSLSPSTEANVSRIPSDETPTTETLKVGETIYAQQCASCHGANLEGEENWKYPNEDGSFRAPPHDDSGHTWHHGDPTLIESIKLGGARFNDMNIGGTSNMPAFGEILSDEEITAVLAYIKSTWSEENQRWQEMATSREIEMSEQ